jgi:glutamine synthetase
MSAVDLVALVCCDLGAIVRGRSLASAELAAHARLGVGWVPANHALTPLGPLAESSPFGSTGDLRLLPDLDTRVRLDAEGDAAALELVLCDIVETDGRPWECCPREFLRSALAELETELGLRVRATFEHEFQLLGGGRVALPFSLEAQRLAEPFASRVFGALEAAGACPERFMAEFASHQFEVPVRSAVGMAGADRAVVVREVVREVARRSGTRASFAPLLDVREAGNGVHVHVSLLDAGGKPVLYDGARPGSLSELGASFAAGILEHADALTALTAASPVSAARLAPHRWGAGAACLAQQNREALLRLPPIVPGAGDPADQLRLEYRGADATANPYIALGALVRAGLDGVRRALPAPPILDRDPAQLDEAEAERFRVGRLPASLEDALAALARDDVVRGWLSPLLYDAYVSVKRAELEAASELDLAELCRRYAEIY